MEHPISDMTLVMGKDLYNVTTWLRGPAGAYANNLRGVVMPMRGAITWMALSFQCGAWIGAGTLDIRVYIDNVYSSGLLGVNVTNAVNQYWSDFFESPITFPPNVPIAFYAVNNTPANFNVGYYIMTCRIKFER